MSSLPDEWVKFKESLLATQAEFDFAKNLVELAGRSAERHATVLFMRSGETIIEEEAFELCKRLQNAAQLLLSSLDDELSGDVEDEIDDRFWRRIYSLEQEKGAQA